MSLVHQDPAESTEESLELRKILDESYKKCYDLAYAASGKRTQSDVALDAMESRTGDLGTSKDENA